MSVPATASGAAEPVFGHPPAGVDHVPLVPTAGAESKTTTCGATVEELLDAGLKIIHTCTICAEPVVKHDRAARVGYAAGATVAGAGRVGTAVPSSASSASSVVNAFVKLNSLLPKWKHTSVCRTFLQRITQILSTSGIEKAKWNLVFMYVVDDVAAAEWITTNIIDKNLDWKASCDKFTAHFEVSDYRVTLQREYNSCKQSKGESVQAYADRFSDICSQLGIADDNPLAAQHFLDHLGDQATRAYYNTLAVLQLTNTEYRVDSLTKAIALCIKLDVANKTGLGHIGSSGSTGSYGSGDTKPKHCKFHPESKTHTTDDCKQNPANKSGNGPSSSTVHHDRQTSAKCYTCGLVGHISPNCPQKTNNSSGSSGTGPTGNPSGQWSTPLPTSGGPGARQSDRTSIPPARLTYDKNGQKTEVKVGTVTFAVDDESRFNLNGEFDGPSVSSVTTVDKVPPTATKRNVLFLFKGLPYEALMDSGADTSCIDSALVKELGIPTIPLPGKVKLADGTLVDRAGKTADMEIQAVFPITRVRLPSRLFHHGFEVLNLSGRTYQFILGADLIEYFFPFPYGPPWEFLPAPPQLDKKDSSSVNHLSIISDSHELVSNGHGVSSNKSPATGDNADLFLGNSSGNGTASAHIVQSSKPTLVLHGEEDASASSTSESESPPVSSELVSNKLRLFQPSNYEYLVMWKNRPNRTWEPADSFLDDTVIKNYWKNTASVAPSH
jgi:hypothetical protein